jgi:8-oxo-dGTP diphosphatase
MAVSLPVALHVFLVDKKEDKVLLLKRANTGFLDGYWSVPAGRLEEGESASAWAKRELLEEVGIKTRNGDWSAPLVMHHKNEKGERIYYFFVCDEWDWSPINAEPDKCDQVEWFAIKDLPKEMISHVRFAFEQMINGTWRYFEYGFEE